MLGHSKGEDAADGATAEEHNGRCGCSHSEEAVEAQAEAEAHDICQEVAQTIDPIHLAGHECLIHFDEQAREEAEFRGLPHVLPIAIRAKLKGAYAHNQQRKGCEEADVEIVITLLYPFDNLLHSTMRLLVQRRCLRGQRDDV